MISPVNPIEPKEANRTFDARLYNPEKTWKDSFLGVIALPFQPIRKMKNYVQGFARQKVYHASAPSFKNKLDGDRLEISRNQLRKLGGETILLVTEDGVSIEGMYMNARKFMQTIVDNDGQFYHNLDNDKVTLRSFDPAFTKLLQEALKLEGDEIDHPHVPLGDPQPMEFELPNTNMMDPSTKEKRVVILTSGNSCIFEFDRKKAGEWLLNGVSCMLFNIRGTGRSHGVPSEENSYKDIEAVYRFLKQEGYEDQQILAYGYCLGSGLATDLVAKHPKVHLMLDRAFAKIGDVIGDAAVGIVVEGALQIDLESKKGKILSALIYKVVSVASDVFVISYDNAGKVKKAKSSVAYISSDVDEVIPEKSRNILKKIVEKMPNGEVYSSDEFGHNDVWNSEAFRFSLDYLGHYHLRARFLPTPLPARFAFQLIARESALEKIKKGGKRSAPPLCAVIGGTLAVAAGGGLAGAGVSGVLTIGAGEMARQGKISKKE